MDGNAALIEAVNALNATVEKLTGFCTEQQAQMCGMQIQALMKAVEENDRAIHGNGKTGLTTRVEVLESNLEHQKESLGELKRILTGIAVAVILTLIGTVLNLVLVP